MIIFYITIILQVFLQNTEEFYIENSNVFPPYTSCSKDGFVFTEGNKCYKTFQHAKNFKEAESVCEKLNSTIASLHSFMDKYNFIKFIEKHKIRNENVIIMSGYRCFNQKICMWIDRSRFILESGFKTSKNDLPCYGILTNHLSSWSCIDKVEDNVNILFVCEKKFISLPDCEMKDYYRKPDGHCYKMLHPNEKFTKRVAQSICRDDGANLPIIHSHLEHFVVNELANGEDIHIGLKCSSGLINAKNCFWSDKSKMDYIGFKEPLTINSLSASCFSTTNEYYWANGSCKHPRRVVCQIRMNYKNRVPFNEININEPPNYQVEGNEISVKETYSDMSIEGIDSEVNNNLNDKNNQPKSIRDANSFLLYKSIEANVTPYTTSTTTSRTTEGNDEIVEEVIEDNIPEKETVTEIDFNEKPAIKFSRFLNK
uniref:C-type lectin domain-containing protein n=1 Tax=Strongyloides papillosus TaxID=174720 RepID=A0A0N5B866_STREA